MRQTFEDGYNSSDYRIYDRNYTREETGDLVTDSGSGEEDAALCTIFDTYSENPQGGKKSNRPVSFYKNSNCQRVDFLLFHL